MAGYPLIPVHPQYRSPSNQAGQILVHGIVQKLSLFHGKSDDELDWHVNLDTSPFAADLADYCTANGFALSAADFAVFDSELMILEDYDMPPAWKFWDSDDFYTADVELPFRLSVEGSATPARALGKIALAFRGGNGHDMSQYSRLPGGRAYLQGAFVTDAAHRNGKKPEIHPLDSIAFAMDAAGRTLRARWGEPGWPERVVTWRIGVFGNSSIHRINGESYMDHPRTTIWYLDLPGAVTANPPKNPSTIEQLHSLQPAGLSIHETQHAIKHKGEDLWFPGRGVYIWPGRELAVDPADGRLKLKVTTTMAVPDKLGGIVVRDYTLRYGDQVTLGS